MKLQNTWANREQFIKDCKRVGACKPDFKRLKQAKTEQDWLDVICRNFWWCVEKEILEESLPENLTCKELDCSNCTSLKLLPKNLTCDVLYCSYCTALTSLPENLTCKELYCRECTALTSLPKNLTCDVLDCSGCTALKSLPKNLTCDVLDCSGCTLIEKDGKK